MGGGVVIKVLIIWSDIHLLPSIFSLIIYLQYLFSHLNYSSMFCLWGMNKHMAVNLILEGTLPIQYFFSLFGEIILHANPLK